MAHSTGISMEGHEAQASPQTYARVGGVLYLIIIVLGLFGEAFIRGGLVVPGDAAATSANVNASEFLWRVTIAGEFVMVICSVALSVIFYVLLRPVSRDLALLAAFFNLVSLAVQATNNLHLMEALSPLANAEYLNALDPEQRYALTYLSIRAHGQGYSVALLLFGCVCLVWGYLIFRSGYLPKVIGVLMQIAGLCYLTHGFILILVPPAAIRLFPGILIPSFVAELSLCLWLLVKGVNVPKWRARASFDNGRP
jgi:hypothetical protein